MNILLSFNALIFFLKEFSTLIRCIIWHKERTWKKNAHASMMVIKYVLSVI